MQVAVQPKSWACPVRRGGSVFPDRADGVRVANQPQLGGRGESSGEVFGGVGQRATTVSVCGRPVGGGTAKSCQEGGQVTGAAKCALGTNSAPVHFALTAQTAAESGTPRQHQR